MSEKPAILLVDDEPDILHSLMGLLRREFEVHTAESGSEALEILAKHTIHVVMTDQRMPEMTGDVLTREVCNQHPNTTRILFTGYADIKSVIEAINHGGLYRYITKPWDPDELVELLHEAALEYKRTTAEHQFKNEVYDFVRRGGQIAAHLLNNEQSVAVDRSDLETFAAAGERLEQRLDEMRN